MDTLSGSGACCVPQWRGARSAREQRAVGTNPRRGLRLPAPPARPALLAAGRRARGCSWEHSGPGTGAQCCPWKPRAALERRLDSAPAEAAEERTAGALRDRLNLQAGRELGGLSSYHWARCVHQSISPLEVSRASPSNFLLPPSPLETYLATPHPQLRGV